MKHGIPRRVASVFAGALGCAGILATGNRRAAAQVDVPSQNPRAIVTDTEAYLVGSPLPLAGAHACAYPDPRGRYVLFARDHEALPPGPIDGQPTTGRATLSLYDSATQRITEIWTTNPPLGGTGAGTVDKVEWLSGNVDAALIVTREDPSPGAGSDRKPEYAVLCLHPADGSRGLKTFLRSTGRLIFWRSPTAPYAVVTEIFDNTGREESGSLTPKRIVDDRGQIGPVLNLDTDFLGLEWSADGKTLFASVPVPPTDDKSGDSGATGARRNRSIAVDATTGEVRTISERPRNRMVSPSLVRQAQPKPPALPLQIVADTVTSTPPGSSSSSRERASVHLTPLYLQYVGNNRNGATTASGSVAAPPLNGSVYLADNGSDATVLSDLSAVVYTAHGALYAVPIVHETRGAFDKTSLLARQVETEAKLKTIASAIFGYVADNDGHHFPPGAGLPTSLKSYLSDPGLLGSGFTYLLNGDPYPGDTAASTLVVATLTGPGGRAVLTADGKVNWEDAP